MNSFDQGTNFYGVVDSNSTKWITTGTVAIRNDVVVDMALGDPTLDYLSESGVRWPWSYAVGMNPEFPPPSELSNLIDSIGQSIYRIEEVHIVHIPMHMLDVFQVIGGRLIRLALIEEQDDVRWAPGIVALNDFWTRSFLDTVSIPYLANCPSPMVVWKRGHDSQIVGFSRTLYSRSIVSSDILTLADRVSAHKQELT